MQLTRAVRGAITLNGHPASAYFILALIAALLALADRRMIRNGGLSGRVRLARHLWRMCFAFFFAAGLFFLGQQRVMPSWLQGAWYLYVLGLAPLALIAFWLISVRVSSCFRARRLTHEPRRTCTPRQTEV